MSTHLHLTLDDNTSQLSAFMQYFESHLVAGLNRMDGVRGPGFERRFTAIEIVDTGAKFERLVYNVLNPVKAGLVFTPGEWPGICLVARPDSNNTYTFRRFREQQYSRAVLDRGEDAVNRDDFIDEETLVVKAPHDIDLHELQEAIDKGAEKIRAERREQGLGFRGAERVKHQNPFDKPTGGTRRKRIPLCHAKCADAWLLFRDEWRVFIKYYRAASEQFRAGMRDADFPPFTFRPRWSFRPTA